VTIFEYDAELLAALARLGIMPKPRTPPEKARELVNDLYRYELRRLRDRLVAREIPKAGYADRVSQLRKRYWMLSLPLDLWAQATSNSSTSV
jgi:hypothetical protein